MEQIAIFIIGVIIAILVYKTLSWVFPKRTHYFVSYKYTTENGHGYGRADITMNGRVRNIEIVRAMEIELEVKSKFKNVSVTNWRLYD